MPKLRRASAAHCARLAKIRKRRQRERDAKYSQGPQNSSQNPERDRALDCPSQSKESLHPDSEKVKQQEQDPTAVIQSHQLFNPMDNQERRPEQVFNIYLCY